MRCRYIRYPLGFSISCLLMTGPAAALEPIGAITPKLGYTGEAAAIIHGGKDKGSAFAGELMVGADADLEALWGWHATTAKFAATYRHGTSLAQDVGFKGSVQGIYGARGARLAVVSIQTKLMDDRLELEAGRIGANVHFLSFVQCQSFQNGITCGNPEYISRNSHLSSYPITSWGGRFKAWFSPNLYLASGVFEVNPKLLEDHQHGFHWSTSERSGYFIPYVLGWKPSDSVPGYYELGGWHDSSTYSDPLRNPVGLPAMLTGGNYAQRHGRSGAFFLFEQQVAQSFDKEHGLTLFGAAIKGMSGKFDTDWMLTGGAVQYGTLSNRPNDTIAFNIAESRYSSDSLRNQRIARALAGGTGTPKRTQISMELNYGIQINEQLRIAPNVQYIIHPNQFNEPSRTKQVANAWVGGVTLNWKL